MIYIKYLLNIKILFALSFVSTTLLSCTPWNLEKKEFPICNKPEIYVTSNINNLNVSFVLLNEKGPIKRALWNFGDGVSLAQLNAGTHTYASSGTYQVKLQIWNACDEVNTYSFSITITALPSVTTLPTAVNTDKTSNLSMSIIGNGGVVISRYGICLSSTNNTPTIDNSIVSSSSINPNVSSNYSFSFSNLTPNTKYYYRAFAQNAFGIVYGNVLTTNTLPVLGHTQIQNAFMPGGRANPISFAIGTKLYVGMGKDDTGTFRNDLWEYDTKENIWSMKQSLPDLGRLSAVGFSINGKGYVGLGHSINGMLKDFWEYNPVSDTWLKKADFPSEARWGTFNLSNNGFGYVGGGNNMVSSFNDFWEYNPTSNTWIKKANLPFYKVNGSGFSIDNVMYMGFGQNIPSANSISGTNGYDFWQFDNNSNQWIRKMDIPSDIISDTKYNFSIAGKGYIGRLEKSALNVMKIYVYSPNTNTWAKENTLEVFSGNQQRYYGCATVVNNIGYYGFGGSGSYFPNSFWIFRPF